MIKRYSSSKRIKKLTKAEAYKKACHFCSYQERTQQETREKLTDFGLPSDEVEELLSKLIVENYVNEERFAKTFAGGKFRIKKWGRNKILQELKFKKLSEYCIKKGLAEIDESDYILTINKLIDEKAASVKEENEYKKKHKIASFLISKGFEPEIIWDILKTPE